MQAIFGADAEALKNDIDEILSTPSSNDTAAAIRRARRDWIARRRDTSWIGGTPGHVMDITEVSRHTFTTHCLIRLQGAIGKPHRSLIYGDISGKDVIVASKGGADHHPESYLNLRASEHVNVQIAAQAFRHPCASPEAMSGTRSGTSSCVSSRPTSTTEVNDTEHPGDNDDARHGNRGVPGSRIDPWITWRRFRAPSGIRRLRGDMNMMNDWRFLNRSPPSNSARRHPGRTPAARSHGSLAIVSHSPIRRRPGCRLDTFSVPWFRIITSIARPLGCHRKGSSRNPPMLLILGTSH